MRRLLVFGIGGAVAVGFVGSGDTFPIACKREQERGAVAAVFVVAKLYRAKRRISPACQPPVYHHVRSFGVGTHRFGDSDILIQGQLVRSIKPHNIRLVYINKFPHLQKRLFRYIGICVGEKVLIHSVFPPGIAAIRCPAVAARIPAACPAGNAAKIIPVITGRVGMLPVKGVGVIETKLDAPRPRRVPQLQHRVAAGGELSQANIIPPLARIAGRVSRVRSIRRGPHGKTVVVLGGNHKVLHTEGRYLIHPFIGVEPRRVKCLYHLILISGHGNFGHTLDMLGIAVIGGAVPPALQAGIRPPMDKAAEPGAAIPFHTLIKLRFRTGVPAVERVQCRRGILGQVEAPRLQPLLAA